MTIATREVRTAKFLKLVGSVTRVRILALLAKGELPVQDIAKKLGMTHSAISHQLSILAAGGVVESVPKGRLAVYSLQPSKAAVIKSALAFV